MRCTWEFCEQDAKHSQKDKFGAEWANLCDDHHADLEAALGGMNIPKLLRSYVKAQGGSKAAASRM